MLATIFCQYDRADISAPDVLTLARRIVDRDDVRARVTFRGHLATVTVSGPVDALRGPAARMVRVDDGTPLAAAIGGDERGEEILGAA